MSKKNAKNKMDGTTMEADDALKSMLAAMNSRIDNLSITVDKLSSRVKLSLRLSYNAIDAATRVNSATAAVPFGPQSQAASNSFGFGEADFGGRRTRHRRKHKRKNKTKRKGRRKKGGHHGLVLLAGAAGMKVYNSLTKKKRQKKKKRKTKRK